MPLLRVSERVEIGKALEGELAKRNGVRHDTSAAKENFPEVKGQTRDLAAKAAGFGNGKTYEQAPARARGKRKTKAEIPALP